MHAHFRCLADASANGTCRNWRAPCGTVGHCCSMNMSTGAHPALLTVDHSCPAAAARSHDPAGKWHAAGGSAEQTRRQQLEAWPELDMPQAPCPGPRLQTKGGCSCASSMHGLQIPSVRRARVPVAHRILQLAAREAVPIAPSVTASGGTHQPGRVCATQVREPKALQALWQQVTCSSAERSFPPEAAGCRQTPAPPQRQNCAPCCALGTAQHVVFRSETAQRARTPLRISNRTRQRLTAEGNFIRRVPKG